MKKKLEPLPEVLKPPFRRSAESERLENYLSNLGVGCEVSYDMIENIIHEDPRRGAGYAVPYGVRKRLMKEAAAVWYVMPGIGLKRASLDEILELSDAEIQAARRKVSKGGRTLNAASVEYETLNNEQRKEFNFLRSVIGALGLFFRRPQQRKLREQVEASNQLVDSRNVLKMFGGNDAK